MKKSLKVALAAVCLIAVGAFFMGCANPNGGETDSGSGNSSSSGSGTGSGTGSGGTGGSGTGSGSSGGGVTYIGKKAPGTALSVGDIVFNDGSATPYSEIADRTTAECTDAEKAAAIAVIFRVGDGTEGNKTLGVGIKHKRSGAGWCKDNTVKGYYTDFETRCIPDDSEKGNLTFKDSTNTDGSKNLAKMIKKLDSNNDTGVVCNEDGTINFTSSTQSTLKTKYPAFEFAYYYGKNDEHNTKETAYETGWYLPSLSELNDIYQANKTEGVIENALDVTGGNKFDKSEYWSSSQSHSNPSSAAIFKFSDGDWSNSSKNSWASPFIYYVCAVRAFN